MRDLGVETASLETAPTSHACLGDTRPGLIEVKPAGAVAEFSICLPWHHKLAVVTHTCGFTTGEVKSGGPDVCSHPQRWSEFETHCIAEDDFELLILQHPPPSARMVGLASSVLILGQRQQPRPAQKGLQVLRGIMVATGGEQRTWGQLSAHTTLRLQLSGSVASLSLWGAGDSATGSMWQEVGTVTHRVAQHPPCGSWDVYGQRP